MGKIQDTYYKLLKEIEYKNLNVEVEIIKEDEFIPPKREDRNKPTYHPQDTPDLYLSEETVNKFIKELWPDNSKEKEVLYLILSSENFHRKEVLNNVKNRKFNNHLNKLVKRFKKIFGEDPLKMPIYRKFYDRVNGIK
jgi:hypothetical protein